MSQFERVIAVVLDHEGGYIDDPADAGGATNYGITINTLKRYRAGAVTKKDVKNLTVGEAKAIYRKLYWDPMGLDFCETEGLALALFDQGVLRGPGTVIRALQKGLKIEADGKFGPASIKRLREVGEQEALKRFLQTSFIAFAEICVRKPSQLKFLVGWQNRVNKLWDLTLPNKKGKAA